MENKYKIIDTHAHYDDEAFDEDREEVLKQIKEAGVEKLMNIACSKKSIETTNNLTLEYVQIIKIRYNSWFLCCGESKYEQNKN